MEERGGLGVTASIEFPFDCSFDIHCWGSFRNVFSLLASVVAILMLLGHSLNPVVLDI